MRYAFIAGVLSFIAGLALQRILIALQRRLHISQVQKSYGVGIDAEVKGSTPTLGGAAFIVIAFAALAARFFIYDWWFSVSDALFFWSLPIACGAIGFTDDWLKLTKKSSEGFSSLRKLKVQLIVAAVWTFWARSRGSVVFWPGVDCPDWIIIPATVLAAAGMMNAVNVTDGLDGLAGGAFLISLGIMACLVSWDSWYFNLLYTVLFGMVASFLFYNVHPARIFMGDAGSHFLGGALVVMCMGNAGLASLIAVGFIFWIELLSSAIQIISIRKFNKRIFKMAPLHHHFQRMGWNETTVTMRFLLIHAVGAIAATMLCVGIWGTRGF